MDEEHVVEPVGGGNEADVLAQILNPNTPQPEAVEAGSDDCINCANNGKVSKLENNECPNCGFVKSNS